MSPPDPTRSAGADEVPPPSVAELLKRADRAFKDQDWASVHAAYQTLRELHPQDRAGWVRGGVAHHRRGDPATAESLLAEAVRRFPDDATAAIEFAAAASTRADWPEEHRRWSLVRERFPDHRMGWLRGGNAQLHRGDLGLAEILLSEARRRFPGDIHAAAGYAEVATRRGDWPEVHRRWDHVRQHFPADKTGWVRGSTAHLHHGAMEHAEGERLIGEAVEKFPDDVSVAVEHAEAAARRGDWPEAHRRWAGVRERFPTNKVGWVRGGVAHSRHGDVASAERLLGEATERFPDDVSAACEFAIVAGMRNDWPQVCRRWAEVRERFPAERLGWVRGGVTLFRHGDLASADSVLGEAVRRYPSDLSAAIEFAAVAEARRDWSEVHRRWAEVRTRFPTERAGWQRGGAMHLRHGDPAQADTLLGKVMRRFPDDASASVQHAEVAMTRGQWPEAARRWAEVRERFPAERAGWIRGAQALLRIAVQRMASDGAPDGVDDAFERLVLEERVDWNDPQYLPAAVLALESLEGGSPERQAIFERLSRVLSRSFSTGTAIEPATTIALCLNVHQDAFAFDETVERCIVSAGNALFGYVFGWSNDVNVSALLGWTRRVVASRQALPLGASRARQLIQFLEGNDHALAMAALAHFLDGHPADDGSGLVASLRDVLSAWQRDPSSAAPAIAEAASRPLRIAVCISGQLRGFERARATWSFLDGSRHTIDRFVHVWQSIGRRMPAAGFAYRTFPEPFRKAYSQACLRLGEAAVEQSFPSLFDALRSPAFETPDRVRTVYGTDHVRLEDDTAAPFDKYSNSSKMYYKIWSCHQLALEAAARGRPYDLIMRIRPDLALERASNLDFERIHVESLTHRMIFADTGAVFDWYGYWIGDQFAIGSAECMTAYASVYELTRQGAPGLPKGFSAHVSVANVTFNDGVRVAELKDVGCGPLLDPMLPVEQIRTLLLKDLCVPPRNVADELFAHACATS